MACGGFVVKVDQQAIPPMAGGAHGVDPAPRHDGLEVHAASLPGTAPTAAVLFRTTGFGVRVLVARDAPARAPACQFPARSRFPPIPPPLRGAPLYPFPGRTAH